MSSHSVSRAPASFTEDGSRSSAACKINRRRVGPLRRETSPPPAPDRRSPHTPAPALGRVWSTSSWTGSRWGGPDAPRSPAAAEWTRSERTPEAGGWESGPCSRWPALRSTARCWPWSGPSRPRRCPTRCAGAKTCRTSLRCRCCAPPTDTCPSSAAARLCLPRTGTCRRTRPPPPRWRLLWAGRPGEGQKLLALGQND